MIKFSAFLTVLTMTALLGAQVPQDGDEPAPETKVHTTSSGLQYTVLKEGKGPRPEQVTDEVEVHYTGWLPDGSVFDSSVKRGVPAKFKLGQVIAGWTEGLQLMNVGSKYKFTIPWQLAYGEEGNGRIPAKTDLVFEVELLGLERGAKVPKMPVFDEAASMKTESGLVYQVLQQPSGAALDAGSLVVLDYTLFTDSGDLLDGTALSGNRISGSLDSMNLPFLKELAAFARQGGVYALRVPPALAFGDRKPMGERLPAGSTTVWIINVERALPFKKVEGDDVKTTESGLRYEVIQEGTGAKPTTTDRVRVHYAGWLTDGNMFDSSLSRGKPTDFGVTQVIKGWTEGLQLMKKGAIYRFHIPSELAYGEGGNSRIPGNADLIFWVELIDIL